MPTIELPQGTLAYQDIGTGPTVVFLHGLLVDGKLWRKVTPELSRSARCIVPDLPLGSHRIPMNPDADLSVEGVSKLVGDFLEALDLRDVTIVGNDSGGAISQIVVGRYGSRVGRLVLTTCDAYEERKAQSCGAACGQEEGANRARSLRSARACANRAGAHARCRR